MEIKANELRIGNQLEITSGIKEQCVVLSISDTHIVYETKSRKGKAVLNCFKPIELTEEILLKCGALLNPVSKIMKSYWIHLKRNLYLNFADIGTSNFMVAIICVDNNDITDCNIIHNWDYDKEMYLHELQNIYKDLSKTELQITL